MARKADKSRADYSLFKKLAPRMMRDLMRDFTPLADFQAAGVVGNGGGESGGFTQIQEVKPIKKGSRGGLGFFQWTGMGTPSKPGRRRAFEKLLKKMGRGPESYDANYEMLRRELRGSERATIPKLRSAKNIDEATRFFMESFERPGIAHYKGRVRWSKMAFAAYESEEKKIAKNPSVASAPV
jgi:Phage tail lysozyme